MSTTTQYQQSQAFNQTLGGHEEVTTNTGSLVLRKRLVELKGIAATVPLILSLEYSAGVTGILGLPDGWGFGLSYVIPGASLTCQGKTSVIDTEWSDSEGYRSGLRYVNDHGVSFREVVPPQDLPSGAPGQYSYVFQYSGGSRDYFDATGKLVEHDDLFGNHVNYAYTDQFQGVFGNRLKTVTDSFGQTVELGYAADEITLGLPGDRSARIEFSAEGVQAVVDAVGNRTSFTYVTGAAHPLVVQIDYPTGLRTTIEPTEIPYLDASGGQGAFPAVRTLTHTGVGGAFLDQTTYAYGAGTGGATFTGFVAGYRLGDRNDALMDSNNTSYLYDVSIERLDHQGRLVAASTIDYNYLHLPVREEHSLIDGSHQAVNGFQALYSYDIDPDLHARTTNYSKPTTVEQLAYSEAAGDYVPLRTATAAYDPFGRMLSATEAMYDLGSKQLVGQTSVAHSYTVTAWGGEMPETSTFIDEVTGAARKILFTLTPDQKRVAAAAVVYKKTLDDPEWTPWKTKGQGYDERGRLTSWTLAWSPGAGGPGVQSTHGSIDYAYDKSDHLLTVTREDALGNASRSTVDVALPGGPLVRQTSPTGASSTAEYDALSRRIKETDLVGNVSTYAYQVASVSGMNVVTSTEPTGYVVERVFDALGRIVEMRDNGDPTAEGTAIDRTLRQMAYNAQGKVSSRTDELGLTTTFAYDGLGRPVESTDPRGNVTSIVRDDAARTTTSAVNGVEQGVVEHDGLGRTVRVTHRPDPDDPDAKQVRIVEETFDGFGQRTFSTVASAPVGGGAAVVHRTSSWSHDPDSRVVELATTGFDPPEVTVVRTVERDLMGNTVGYVKTTRDADGTSYRVDGPTLAFDAISQLTSVTTPLDQVESYRYDADSRLTRRTRFDGTTFSYAYDDGGNLLEMEWDGGSRAYTYLANGRTRTVSGGGETITYSYTLDGSAEAIEYSGGQKISFTLDRVDRVVAMADPSGATTETTFDELGRLKTRTHGGDTLSALYGTANHVHGALVGLALGGGAAAATGYDYDGFGNLKSVVSKDGSGRVLLASGYRRDVLGRLEGLELVSAVSTGDAVNLTHAFDYDGANRLVSRRTTAPGGGVLQTLAYRFDGNDNVLSRTENGSTESFEYNAIDQLEGGGVVYDANGRLVADGAGNRYAYDALDQLVAVEKADGATVRYAYHPDGALAAVTSQAGGLRFFHATGAIDAVESVSPGQEADWTSFLSVAGARHAAYPDGEAPVYFTSANRSTVLARTADGGADALAYDPFGRTTSDSSLGGSTSFTWNQEYNDPQSHLVYLRSRYYNPELLSFMTMDGSLQENRYAYCQGNPIDLLDPTGQASALEIAGLAVSAVVGVVATLVTGFLAGAAAAAVFGTECEAASVAATAFANAVGAVAADGTDAGITGQRFTGERAAIDAATGAAAGAAGAVVGGAVGRAASALALSRGLSRGTITAIGTVTSGLAGGTAGAATAAGVTSLVYDQPFFSAATALSLATGAAGGFGGGLLASGSYLGLLSSKILPVPISDEELGLIRPARNQSGARLSNALLVMAPQEDADSTAAEFRRLAEGWDDPRRWADSALTLDYQETSETYDTIAAHGAGNTLYVSVASDDSGVPRLIRPITGRRFASYLRRLRPSWRDSDRPIKLMSCFGAFSNAQTIADALGRDVYAGYSQIGRYTFTNWKLFRARP